MKKTFLNLRKIGFVMVAATSMVAFSCGGGEEEATDEATTEETTTEETTTEEVVVEETCDAACDGADTTGGEATCDGGESCETAE